MMLSRALVFFCAAMPLASGLRLSRKSEGQNNPLKPPIFQNKHKEGQHKPHEDARPVVMHMSPTRPGGNAYVMMWIAKKNVPEGIKLRDSAMTEEEEEAEIKAMEAEGYTSVRPRSTKLHQNMAEQSLESNADSTWVENGPEHLLMVSKELRAMGSKYPLVLLTNAPKLVAIKHNTTLQEQYPNVVIRELADDEWLKHECKMAQGHLTHFQKLSIFGLTDYDKLLWMDADVKAQKNMDSVFDEYDTKDGQQVWGQHDNWMCEKSGQPKFKEFCSGMMLFTPKAATLQGLVDHARSVEFCWGDQRLISQFFGKGGHSKMLFPRSVVTWGQCGAKHSMAAHNQQSR